jgi:PAS domain S-box-containing protein
VSDVDPSSLAADLHHAIEREELRVHYLPIVGLGDGRVIGVEALARWHRGDRMVDTQQFVSLAEKTGAIVPIGRWVMERACQDVTAWSTEHPDRAPLRLAVNLSLHQLTEPDAVEHLARMLERTGLDPMQLSLEVSEDSLHELGHAVGPTLLALKQLGIRLSVDDFGTGASSLLALQRYHLDELKIDRSFVAQMDADGDAAAIVRGVVGLAESLGLDTVAEGVERPAQEQMLRGLRCGAAQGWLYARPGADVSAVVVQAEEAAVGSMQRKPVEHDELWRGRTTPATAARFFEAVFESAPIGMALIDDTGRHIAANPALGRLLGHRDNELLDKTCWEVVHPEDLQRDLAGMDALLQGECLSYVVEERVVGVDGTARWVEVTVSGVPGDDRANGTPTRLLRQIRSIEDSRRSSEDAAVLRSIIAASPDPLIITDGVGRCTHWNPAAAQLFGWTEQQMLGAPLTRLVAPSGQLQLARVLADATGGGAVRWADATWIDASGGPCAVDVTVGPIVDSAGARVGLVAIARDVTDQRAAAVALREAHEALEGHATDLAAANVRLESFASTLSHDLLQPVAALDGFLSLLERDATELDADHRSWLAGAIRGKDRVAQAIDALYRNAAADDLPLVPVDLAAVVDELVPGLVAEMGDAELVIGELPVVAADHGFVTQVLANLVQNAGRYRHDQRPLVIDIQARPDGTSWLVVVADTGRGISTDELERVFEPGTRGRSSDGTAGSGTGLATVRTLMQRMGGEVWAEPEPAGGVRMCLRFGVAHDRQLVH